MNFSVSDQLEHAFKKLKASVYFDKTQLVLRNRLVQYESTFNGNTKDNFIKIDNLLTTASEKDWESYQNDLLSSIRALTYPKNSKNTNNNDAIILNSSNSKLKLNDVKYFFDANVEVQLLGVLWILHIGTILDRDFYQHSYGNRLNKALIDKTNTTTTFSPYLFKPYFEQYENWRDIGLKFAQDSLENKQDAIVLTLDFKDFYHSVNFDQEAFNLFIKKYFEIFDKNNSDKMIYRLNDFIFQVLKSYSGIFSTKHNIFLPIGFFPSNILSNWYLNNFDDEVINCWNPIYYGRYVDDIIIVDKVEKNSPISKKANSDYDLKVDDIIEYFLGKGDFNLDLTMKNKKALLIKENDSNAYKVNSEIFNHETELIINATKIKIFYFNHNASHALLTCFRNEINHNKSEFRFLPEDHSVKMNDYSEIYDLKYSDTLNKLRGVDGITIDKYALSKFLGKFTRVGVLINDQIESKFENDIDLIYSPQTIIDNYITWEKLIQHFVVNNRFVKLKLFVIKVISSINNSSVTEKNNSQFIIPVQQTLKEYLFSALSRSLSHNWGPIVKNGIIELFRDPVWANEDKQLFAYEFITDYRRNYCFTRMSDKYILPTLIDTFIDQDEDSYSVYFSDQQFFNLTNLNDYFEYAKNLNLKKTKYIYYPYMITPQDILVALNLDMLCNSSQLSEKSIVNQMHDLYSTLNFPGEENWVNVLNGINVKPFMPSYLNNSFNNHINSEIVHIGNNRNSKFRIGISNALLTTQNFTNALVGNPNRSFERYSNMAKIINTSINENVNILILPENYVPLEWIPTLARISAKTQMAIITGIEHIKIKNKVYNLTATILPYSYEDYHYSYISFHTKVHYSPNEIHHIHGYGFQEVPGNSYTLFKWNDLWFSTYCCYELASIKDRSLFLSYVDLLAIIEWNHDINYFSNIIDSLSRDMHCYCAQVNTRDYGDSRITQPTETEKKDIVKTKGGLNDTVIVGEINTKALRDFQIKEYNLQKEDPSFKPTPPQFDRDIVHKKRKGKL